MASTTHEEMEQLQDSHVALFDEMYGTSNADLDDDENPNMEVTELPDTEPVAAVEKPQKGKPFADPEPKTVVQAPTETDPYAWIDSLPETHRDSASKLRHEALSDRGRVSALSRKINEMQQSLDAMASRATVAPEITNPAKATAHEPSDKIKQLKEDYPELGAQLDDILAYERSQAEALVDSRLKPLQDKFASDAKASEEQRLDSAAAEIFHTEVTGIHWKDVVKSDDFNAWLLQQPVFVQSAARTTNSASEGLEILRMYENAYQAAVGATQASALTTKNPEESTTRGDNIRNSRNKRKETTVSPASRPAGTETEGLAGDHETMFNAMWSAKPSRR